MVAEGEEKGVFRIYQVQLVDDAGRDMGAKTWFHNGVSSKVRQRSLPFILCLRGGRKRKKFYTTPKKKKHKRKKVKLVGKHGQSFGIWWLSKSSSFFFFFFFFWLGKILGNLKQTVFHSEYSFGSLS